MWFIFVAFGNFFEKNFLLFRMWHKISLFLESIIFRDFLKFLQFLNKKKIILFCDFVSFFFLNFPTNFYYYFSGVEFSGRWSDQPILSWNACRTIWTIANHFRSLPSTVSAHFNHSLWVEKFRQFFCPACCGSYWSRHNSRSVSKMHLER